jgi:hypothetical protein
MTVGISFSKGEFPEESDFPSSLHSSKLSAILPLYRMDLGNLKKKDPALSGNSHVNSEPPKRNDGGALEHNSMMPYSSALYQNGLPAQIADMHGG